MSPAESRASRTEPGGSGILPGRWGLGVALIVGLLNVAAGVVVLAEPAISLVTLAVVSGILLVADGIIETVAPLFGDLGNRGFSVLIGIVSVIGGILLIRHPALGIVLVAMFLGLWLIVAGAIRLAWTLGERPFRPWELLLAAIECIAGIVIVASPGIGVATLALLVGISFILRGVMLCAGLWLLRQAQGDRRVAPHGPVTAA